MQLVKLNACPKCGGALVISEDEYGKRLVCLSCGWQRDVEIDQPMPKVYDTDAEEVRVPDGCAISPSCLTCPLEDCLYESRTNPSTYLWDRTALALFEQYKGLGTAKAVAAVAEGLKVPERRIYRALKRRAA
jgi:DNA-directed RNA polymerase subunit M/transcription elongation factor TFIIS